MNRNQRLISSILVWIIVAILGIGSAIGLINALQQELNNSPQTELDQTK